MGNSRSQHKKEHQQSAAQHSSTAHPQTQIPNWPMVHEDGVSCVSFLQDLLITGGNDSVRLGASAISHTFSFNVIFVNVQKISSFNLKTREVRKFPKSHTGAVTQVCVLYCALSQHKVAPLSNQGGLVSSSRDRTLRVWAVGEMPAEKTTLIGHEAAIASVATNSGGIEECICARIMCVRSRSI